mmetsp:Transcript_45069/g.86194  ORF Transcript_45069/g.86194 Transcript_45069/m.86194 type:complete len:202 (-) Transcript_45069:455-1060(-)
MLFVVRRGLKESGAHSRQAGDPAARTNGAPSHTLPPGQTASPPVVGASGDAQARLGQVMQLLLCHRRVHAASLVAAGRHLLLPLHLPVLDIRAVRQRATRQRGASLALLQHLGATGVAVLAEHDGALRHAGQAVVRLRDHLLARLHVDVQTHPVHLALHNLRLVEDVMPCLLHEWQVDGHVWSLVEHPLDAVLGQPVPVRH